MDALRFSSSLHYDDYPYSLQDKLDSKDTLECFIDSFKALMHYNPIMLEIFNDPLMLISTFPEMKSLISNENLIPGCLKNYRVKPIRKGYQININGKLPIKYYHKNIQSIEGYMACKALKLKVQQTYEQLFIYSNKLFDAFDMLGQETWTYHKVSFNRSFMFENTSTDDKPNSENKSLSLNEQMMKMNEFETVPPILQHMNLIVIRNLVKFHDVYLLRE